MQIQGGPDKEELQKMGLPATTISRLLNINEHRR
jgi:hypothetical protein